MDAPVYQDLSWQRYGALDSQQPSSQHQPQQQQTIKHTYRAQLEQKRDRIIQNLQQSPPNRIDLEHQLHRLQTEIYYLNQAEKSYSEQCQKLSIKTEPSIPPSSTETGSTVELSTSCPTSKQSSATSWTKQFIDSGIASGNNTSPPSEDGGNTDYQNDIDDELAMHNIPQFDWETPYQKGNSQTRSQRLRAELFPDTNDDGYQQQYSSPITPTTPLLNLQTVGEPSDQITNVLPQFQDDDKLALQAVPEFAKLLNDNSLDILAPVATCIHQFSKKESSMHAILSCPQLLTNLIKTLSTSSDIEVRRCCVGTLHNLSYLLEGLDAIHKYRGTTVLCDLLTSSNDNILYYTIATLHNLIQRNIISHTEIHQSGGVEKMVALLKFTDKGQFVAMVADCLYLLCHRNPERKLTLVSCDGAVELVKVLQTSTLEYLSWAVARVLKTLSVCNHSKKSILDAGGMHALARQLDTGSSRVTEEVLYTMRNLSNAVCKDSNMEVIITKLMDVLARTNVNFIACSVGCLSNLTCNNPSNKKTIFRLGGMDTLLRCLLYHHNIPSISEPLLCTLRHINYKHPESEQTQHAFRNTGGISLISKVLSTATHWAVIKATCGLIRNLALTPDNIPFFKDTGILMQLLQCSLRLTENHKSSFLETRDGIRLEQIVCEVIKTIQTVSGNSDMSPHLTNSITVALVMRVVNCNNEELVESALTAIINLKHEDAFIAMIKRDPGVDLFEKLSFFRNSNIVNMASIISKRLAEVSLDSRGVLLQAPYETLPQWNTVMSENGGTLHHGLNDVVDLDTTTAQYKNLKSPPTHNYYGPYGGRPPVHLNHMPPPVQQIPPYSVPLHQQHPPPAQQPYPAAYNHNYPPNYPNYSQFPYHRQWY